MGSTGGDQKDEITVLVTGFEPFKDGYPCNPSWEIASRLPPYLPPLRAKTTAPASALRPDLQPVRILVHPEAVKVSYDAVRELVPSLWDESDEGIGRKIDFVVHIGMAGEEEHYNVERKGHRGGYYMPDKYGEYLGDEKRRQEEGEDWIWHGVPAELETDLDLDDVLRRWKSYSPNDSDLRISHDAGHYLCDFIYFSSLAHLYKKDDYRRVVFLHVPSKDTDAIIERGTELLTQLIRAIVDSERTRSKRRESR